MKRKLSNALLIANYVINHDTDITHVSVSIRHNRHTFSERERIEALKEEGTIGRLARKDILNALQAIGQDDTDVLIYIGAYADIKMLCFSL